jgi:hypothetical protein
MILMGTKNIRNLTISQRMNFDSTRCFLSVELFYCGVKTKKCWHGCSLDQPNVKFLQFSQPIRFIRFGPRRHSILQKPKHIFFDPKPLRGSHRQLLRTIPLSLDLLSFEIFQTGCEEHISSSSFHHCSGHNQDPQQSDRNGEDLHRYQYGSQLPSSVENSLYRAP